MTLDEAIQHTREVACENHDCAYEHKQLAGWLQELKQRRECELKPVGKIADNLNIVDQFNKVLSEINEIKCELSKLLEVSELHTSEEIECLKNKVGLECFDGQTALETLLKKLGFVGKKRMELQRMGLEKNMKRGYYNTAAGFSSEIKANIMNTFLAGK